ncbi:MAG TPA: hypothetical protein VIM14_09495 [Polyangia bacterium]
MATQQQTKGETRLFWLSAVVLSGLAVGAVFCVDYLPTNDGPQHVFQSFAARHLEDVGRGYARYIERGAPVSSLGFDLIDGMALRVLPWRHALRVALAINVLVWSWGVLVLALALRPTRRWMGLIGFAAAFQWSLYMGFFSFYLATGLGFWIAAFAVWSRTWTFRGRALLAGALLLQTVAHVFAAAGTGTVLGVLALSRSTAKQRTGELGKMCLMAVPAACVAWLSRTRGSGALVQMGGPWSLLDRLGMLASCFVGGPAWRAWPVVILALVGAATFVVRTNSRRDPEQRALFFVGVLFLGLAVWAPFDLPNWNFFALRFVPCAVVYLAVLLPTDKFARSWLRAGLAVALAVYAIASLSWAWGYHRELRQRSGDALSGLDAPIVRSGPRLPLILDPLQGEPFDPLRRSMPFVVSSLSLDMLYVTAQGGVSPNQFMPLPTLHPVVWRDDPSTPFPLFPPGGASRLLMDPIFDPGRRIALLNYIASYSPGFEDILLLGNPSDTAVILQRGFAIDWERGGFTIARFRGCPLRLVVAGAEHTSHAILVQAGWYPASRTTYSRVIAPSDSRAGPLVVPIDAAPCGKVWVQLDEDLNDDGQVSAKDRFCGGATLDGRLVVDVDATHSEFYCRLGEVASVPR